MTNPMFHDHEVTENPSDDNTVIVITPPCIQCKKTSEVVMTVKQYHDFAVAKKFIHEIFPEKTAGERELLISGTHEKCWDEMFGGMDN